jgi:flagellin
MRTLDAASGVLSRLQELAVLGANETNTSEDAVAIDSEAEALGAEFHRLLSTAKYKGKDLFLAAAGGEYVSLGGRDAEMTFGVKKVQYTEMYLHSYLTYAAEHGTAGASDNAKITAVQQALQTADIVQGRKYRATVKSVTGDTDSREMDAFGGPAIAGTTIAVAGTLGTEFTATKSGNTTDTTGLQTGRVVKSQNQLVFTASEGANNGSTDSLTAKIESVQGKLNTARVQAGSQYAALESAVGYVTDLTAQYELGYNAVNDVNFSMETAHLAKNQILQQAATAMLAQANQGQQSLLQLIQG